MLQKSVFEPPRGAILEKLPFQLLYDPWGNFRISIQEIYRVEMKSGADITTNLSKGARSRSKSRRAAVVSRKEGSDLNIGLSDSDEEDEIPSGNRVPSEQSNIGQTEDSSGGGLVVYAQENPTNGVAELMIRNVLSLWQQTLPLSFAPKERPITLKWQTYLLYLLLCLMPCIGVTAELNSPLA